MLLNPGLSCTGTVSADKCPVRGACLPPLHTPPTVQRLRARAAKSAVRCTLALCRQSPSGTAAEEAEWEIARLAAELLTLVPMDAASPEGKDSRH